MDKLEIIKSQSLEDQTDMRNAEIAVLKCGTNSTPGCSGRPLEASVFEAAVFRVVGELEIRFAKELTRYTDQLAFALRCRSSASVFDIFLKSCEKTSVKAFHLSNELNSTFSPDHFEGELPPTLQKLSSEKELSLMPSFRIFDGIQELISETRELSASHVSDLQLDIAEHALKRLRRHYNSAVKYLGIWSAMRLKRPMREMETRTVFEDCSRNRSLPVELEVFFRQSERPRNDSSYGKEGGFASSHTAYWFKRRFQDGANVVTVRDRENKILGALLYSPPAESVDDRIKRSLIDYRKKGRISMFELIEVSGRGNIGARLQIAAMLHLQRNDTDFAVPVIDPRNHKSQRAAAESGLEPIGAAFCEDLASREIHKVQEGEHLDSGKQLLQPGLIYVNTRHRQEKRKGSRRKDFLATLKYLRGISRDIPQD